MGTLVAVGLGSVMINLKSSNKASKKAKKNKSAVSTQEPHAVFVTSLAKDVVKSMDLLASQLEVLQKESSCITTFQALSSMSLEDDDLSQFSTISRNKIQDSYKFSFEQIIQILQEKKLCLSTIMN